MRVASIAAAAAAVLAAVLVAAAAPAQAGIHTFSVDMLHRAVETHDPEMAAEAYAEGPNTLLTVNGQTFRGREEIRKYYEHLEKTLLIQRVVVSTPVYETGQLVHYGRQSFMIGDAGCLASVRSFEQVTFDEDGHVTRHVSEWLESPAAVQDDLDCHHGDHGGDHGHHDAMEGAVNAVYGFHHAIETASGEDLAAQLAPGAVMTLDGDESTALSGPEVLSWWEPVLEQLKTAVYTPVGAVQSRGTRSVTPSALFYMTNTGCSGTFELIVYFTHADDGKITRFDVFAVGGSAEDMRRSLLEDCGFGPTHDEL